METDPQHSPEEEHDPAPNRPANPAENPRPAGDREPDPERMERAQEGLDEVVGR